jgi:hypothetical protein
MKAEVCWKMQTLSLYFFTEITHVVYHWDLCLNQSGNYEERVYTLLNNLCIITQDRNNKMQLCYYKWHIFYSAFHMG